MAEARLDRRVAGPRPPLADSWDKFLSARSWPKRFEERIFKLNQIGHGNKAIATLVQKLRQIDLLQPYASISEQARRLRIRDYKQETLTLLEKVRHQQREAHPSEPLEVDEEAVQRQVRELGVLEKFLNAPRYGRCFTVLGSSGSGKTHFIASILNGQLANEQTWVLPFTLETASHDVGRQVLDAAGAALEVIWPDFNQLNNFLRSEDLRLVVAVDEVHAVARDAPSVWSRLLELIGLNTGFERIDWIFTCLDTRYDDIADQEDFILSYGPGSDDEATASPWRGRNERGWLMLDELNERHRLGLQVLREFGDDTVHIEEDTLDSSTLRQLCSPFAAWILIDALKETQTPVSVVNLHYIEFMERFWEARLRRNKTLRLARGRDAVRRIAAWQLVSMQERVCAFGSLVDSISSTLSRRSQDGLVNANDVDQVLRLLLDANLLVRPLNEGRSEPREEPVKFSFESFWYWTVASAICEKSVEKNDLPQRLQSAVRQSARRESAEAIVEMTLLLDELRHERVNSESREASALWRKTFADARTLTAAHWFAASKARPQTQQRLVDALSERGRLSLDSRTAFALLHFLANAVDVDRVKLLHLARPHLQHFAEHRFGRYFLYVAGRQLGGELDPDRVARCMAAFVGAEVMDIEEPLAHLSMGALGRACPEPSQMISLLMQHVCAVKERPDAQRRGPVPPRSDASTAYSAGTPIRRTWREWVFRLLCEKLLERYDVDAFKWLDAAGWYAMAGGEITPGVRTQMHRQANFAFGFWYRAPSHHDKRAPYEQLVDVLSRHSEVNKRKTAFYMIRHTAATYQQDEVGVDIRFHPILARLRADPALSELVKKWERFFRFNLDEDE